MRKYQRGQSMLMMLAFAGVLASSMFFIFNSSQLLSERQQAKMLADHTAHATATKQARLLNMNAYVNRAQVANEMAIAQAVSLGSWTKYASTLSRNVGVYLIWLPGIGTGLLNLSQQMESANQYISPYIDGYAAAVYATQKAQNAMNVAANIEFANFPRQFVRANNPDYSVLAIVDSSGYNSPFQILNQHTGNERRRMAEVLNSTKANSFIGGRKEKNSYPSIPFVVRPPFPFPGLKGSTLYGRVNIKKRGGAELVSLDEWKSVDTLSFHSNSKYLKWTWSGPRVRTQKIEMPLGYGSAAVSSTGKDSSWKVSGSKYRATNDQEKCASEFARPLTGWALRFNKNGCLYPRKFSEKLSGSYGGSHGTNPIATKLAQRADNRPTWDVKSDGRARRVVGVPEYYELKDLTKTDPVFNYTYGVSKDVSRLKIANKKSEVKVGSELVDYADNMDSGKMYAMSRAQVYFQRPWELEVQKNTIQHESGSLFSPYWQVKITDDVKLADKMLGSAQKRLH